MQRDPADLSLTAFRDCHRGRPGAVLGGGPGLITELDRIPSDALLFGVNQHALLLQLDYVVFQDERIAPVVAGHPTARAVTPRRVAGAIWSGVCPDFGFSGMDAVWVADWMGCDPIYVAGIDCYSGVRPYWHSIQTAQPLTGARDPVAEWHKVRDALRHPERVRVFAGPLTEIFRCA